jgi:hypothetical protein
VAGSRKVKKTIALTFVLAIASGIIIGCASSVDRGSLSEAVDKSNDDYKGDRRVTGTSTDNGQDEESSSCLSSCLFGFMNDDDETTGSTPVNQETSSTVESGANPDFTITGPNYFGARILTSNRLSINYTHSAGGGLLWVNHYKKKRAFEVALQTEVITTGEKSRLFGSINRIVDLELGLHTRRYSTPDFTVMGLYLKYGCDLNFLFWYYRNPVVSEIRNEQGNLLDSETIYTDGLFGINADIGVGWSLVQMKYAKISVELIIGGTLFWLETFESFKNDMFYPDGFIKADVEVMFGKGER